MQLPKIYGIAVFTLGQSQLPNSIIFHPWLFPLVLFVLMRYKPYEQVTTTIYTI